MFPWIPFAYLKKKKKKKNHSANKEYAFVSPWLPECQMLNHRYLSDRNFRSWKQPQNSIKS